MPTYRVNVPKLNQRKYPVTDTADKSNVVSVVVMGYTFEAAFAFSNICGDWYIDPQGYYYWGAGLELVATPAATKPVALAEPIATQGIQVPETEEVMVPVVPDTNGLPEIQTTISIQPEAPIVSNEKAPFPDYGIPDIWLKTKGEGVSIALIDTGLHYEHPAFKSKQGIVYYNVAKQSSLAADCLDDTGRGTACAGIIASQLADKSGIAPDAHLIIIKAAIDGGLKGKDLASAIDKAIELGADIIAVGYGFYWDDMDIELINDAVVKANAKNVLIVAAATDSGMDRAGQHSVDIYPASYNSCLGVGACNAQKDFAHYTQMNNNIGVLAPGDIEVLVQNASKLDSSTSYATAFVAAVCALYFSAQKNKNPAEFIRKIKDTSTDKTKVQQEIQALYTDLSSINDLGIIHPAALF